MMHLFSPILLAIIGSIAYTAMESRYEGSISHVVCAFSNMLGIICSVNAGVNAEK